MCSNPFTGPWSLQPRLEWAELTSDCHNNAAGPLGAGIDDVHRLSTSFTFALCWPELPVPGQLDFLSSCFERPFCGLKPALSVHFLPWPLATGPLWCWRLAVPSPLHHFFLWASYLVPTLFTVLFRHSFHFQLTDPCSSLYFETIHFIAGLDICAFHPILSAHICIRI